MADREQQHPLLNNLVAKEILKYSSLEDLAAHRLVCKTWFEESLTRWRSTATLNILQGEQDSDSRDVDADESGTTLHLQELRDIFSQGDDGHQSFLRMDTKPFAKYRLKKWKIKEIPIDSYVYEQRFRHRPKPKIPNLSECPKNEIICGAEDFPSFWQKIGPLMRSLTVEDFEFGEHHHNPLLAIIFEHTPNLVALKLSRCAFPEDEYQRWNAWSEITKLEHWNLEPKATLTTLAFDGAISVLLEEILGYFPCLESLTLHRWNVKISDEAMRNISSMTLTPNLKHLDILRYYDCFDENMLFRNRLRFFRTAMRLFRERSEESTGERRLLPLKTLELGSINPPLHAVLFEECISDIFDTYAEFGGLEVIKLYMAPFCEQTLDLKMTRMMESAKHFEVWGNWLQSLGFLYWMPYLETLEVHISCFEKWDQTPQLKKGFKDYRGIVCKRFVTNFNEDIVQNALQSHPAMNGYVGVHLKCLHVDYEFGTGSLKTLSKWMPHLKELKTILNNGTLRTVCGLWTDLEKLDLVYGSSVDDEAITGINENEQKMGRHRKQNANLTKLKKLKSFRLETYCGLSKLGDFSATEAFLKMDTLQFLEICVSPEMSVDVEAELKKAIPNAQIIRNYGDEDLAHRRYGKCCKRLQFLFESVEGSRSAYEQSIFNINIIRSIRLHRMHEK